ncbi:MAG TPA: transcriptional regulator NrdR [Anaerolineae bacterium]
MKCPACGSSSTHVVDTIREPNGGIRRRRECKSCGKRFSTVERIVATMPLIVKRGGRREAFNREKILMGIRTACAKRPVSADDIDRLVDQVEARVMALNKTEVSGRDVGDMVLNALRGLDEVAYIRYASVYLHLKDLESVKREIEKLLAER